MNLPALIQEYKSLRNFGAHWNAAHPSPKKTRKNALMRQAGVSPSPSRRSPSVRVSGALGPFWGRNYKTTNGPLSNTF
jgi:hypothetical protein